MVAVDVAAASAEPRGARAEAGLEAALEGPQGSVASAASAEVAASTAAEEAGAAAEAAASTAAEEAGSWAFR